MSKANQHFKRGAVEIRPSGPTGAEVILSVRYGATATNSAYIPNADVPVVALELLKAAGQESVIVPKSETPTFVVDGNYLSFTAPDGYRSLVGLDWTPERLRHFAMARLATADYLEATAAREAAEKAEAEAAEKKLQERRDAVKTELVKAMLNRTEPTDMTQVAIDRIIELEDGAFRD